MILFSKTDTGRVRSSNQDAVNSGLFDGGCWGVVCDGMGGANGGDIAGSRAAQIIGEMLTDFLMEDMSGSAIRQLIEDAVDKANMEIFRQSQTDPALAGMGTTVVCAVVSGDTLHIAHAGDSRAYLMSDGGINQITRDHSMVQELVDLGRLTQEEARNHPRKNIITRALGVYPKISVDHTECSVEKGDTVLLCSDGLSNCVDDAKLLEMSEQISVDALCDAYINEANQSGGFDNITALVIRI